MRWYLTYGVIVVVLLWASMAVNWAAERFWWDRTLERAEIALKVSMVLLGVFCLGLIPFVLIPALRALWASA